MKTFLKTALAIFLVVSVTDMNAQIKSGYTFGINLSTMKVRTNSLISNPTTPVSIHFGAIYDIPIKGRFSLQPSLLFSAKGTDYKIDSSDYSISPIYLEIPVMIAYSFGSDAVKISLFTGPYFACGIGGYKIQAGSELQRIRYGGKEYNDLKPFDYGFNFGAGVSIKGFLISAQYGLGMANVSPFSTVTSEMKNTVIGISISSLFAHK